MRADVHLERTQAVVLFGTVLAVEGRSGACAGGSCSGNHRLWAGGAVRELMARQRGRAAAGLAAVGALEAVGRVWAGRVRCTAVVLLSAAAGAGLRAQVQRPRRRGDAG